MARVALIAAMLVSLCASVARAQGVDDFAIPSYMQTFGVSEEVAREHFEIQARGARLGEDASAALGAAYGGVWIDQVNARWHVLMTAAGDRSVIEPLLEKRDLTDHADIDVVEFPIAQVYAGIAQATTALGRWLPQQLVSLGTDVKSNAVNIRISDATTPDQRAAIESAVSGLTVPTTFEILPADSFWFVPAVAKVGTAHPTDIRLLSRKLTRRTRSVRISFHADSCGGPPGRVLLSVRLREHRIVITARTASPDVGPYFICPGKTVLVKRRVPLQGRLGRRAIVDGATGRTLS